MKEITPQRVKQMCARSDKFALLDVREEGVFSKGHALFSSCVPLSRLECMIRDLVPRFDTNIILTNRGPSDRRELAELAAPALKHSDIEMSPSWKKVCRDGVRPVSSFLPASMCRAKLMANL